MKRVLLILILAPTVFGISRAQLTLDTCQALARENYPTIRQYGLVAKSTDYNVANVKTAWWPQLNLSAQATYQSEAAGFPEKMQSIYNQMGINLKGIHRDQYRVALDVNQMVYDGGATRANRAQAEAAGKVATEQVNVSLYDIRSRVNDLYFGILLIKEQLSQNLLLQNLLQDDLKKMQSCVRNGVAMQSDADVVEAQLLTTHQQQTELEAAGASYRDMLALFIGRAIAENTTFEKPNPLSLNSMEVSSRPELNLYNARIAQSEVRKAAINASLKPKFSLFATGFYGYPGYNMFEDMLHPRLRLNAIVGARIQWNMGAFYTKKNDLSKIDNEQRQIETERATFLFNTRMQSTQQQNNTDKLLRLKSEDDRIVALRTSVRKASESKLANGVIDTNRLLSDLTSEHRAKLDLVIHEVEWLQAQYQLKNTVEP
jgi:outer membrane protein TolC